MKWYYIQVSIVYELMLYTNGLNSAKYVALLSIW
jgi:hypothetical protein